mgnify:FL=1
MRVSRNTPAACMECGLITIDGDRPRCLLDKPQPGCCNWERHIELWERHIELSQAECSKPDKAEAKSDYQRGRIAEAEGQLAYLQKKIEEHLARKPRGKSEAY